MNKSSVGFACVVLSCVVPLTSCSHSAHSSTLSKEDERFVSQMIPHHELGMKLIEDATLHSNDVRLRRMVFEMSGYHGSELDQLHELVHSHGANDTTEFPGSIPVAALDKLASLDGPAHDTLWLNLMITHHEGALVIVADASSDESSDVVATIASNTRTVQSRELTEMRELLRELCSANSSLPGC